MSTQKELAWRALKIAEDRLLDAALALMGKPPTAAEVAAYRSAKKAIARAHREYWKATDMECGK